MTRTEAKKLYKECTAESNEIVTTNVTRTIKSVKIIYSSNHDITFLFYKGDISKIEEFNGRELIEKYVER